MDTSALYSDLLLSFRNILIHKEGNPLESIRSPLNKMIEDLLELSELDPDHRHMLQSGCIPFFNAQTPDESMPYCPIIFRGACNIFRKECGTLFNAGATGYNIFIQMYNTMDDSMKEILQAVFTKYSDLLLESIYTYTPEFTADITELVEGWNSVCELDMWKVHSS